MGFRTDRTDYKPVPQGCYLACLVSLVDLGHGAKYGKERVAMKFELYALPGEPSLDENGRTRPPHVWTMPMTLSMYREARLATLIAGWDDLDAEDVGEAQDLEERLGNWARARIAHEERNGRVYACLAGLAPLEAGDAASFVTPYYKPGWYDVREGRCEGFDRLPGWLQAQAMASRDWPGHAIGNERAADSATTNGNASAHRPRDQVNPEAVREAAARHTGADGFEAMADDVPF